MQRSGFLILTKGRHDLFGKPVYFLLPLRPTAHHELTRHVLHTDVLKAVQRGYKLLRVAFELILHLGYRLPGDFNRAAATELDLRGISANLACQFSNVGKLCSHILRRDFHKVGEPGVGICGGPFLRRFAFSTRPNGEARFLNRLGADRHRVETVMFALEARLLLLPESVEDLKLLIGHRSPVLERHAQRVELFDHPANSNAQDKSSI